MRIPYSIPKNVFEAFRCSQEIVQSPIEHERTIRAEDEFWDEKNVPKLKVLALRVIVSTWEKKPVLEELPTCEDRDLLMEILPTNLPFKLTIRLIEDEQYWERCARNRWEYNNLPKHGGSWRRLYCEGHFREYLESLEPTYFESQKEECQEVIKLVQNHIHILELRSLRPTKKRTPFLDDEDPCILQEEPVSHIPFQILLPQLPNLTELLINFGVIYMSDGFEWRDFEFSIEDCLGLGRGIAACPNLRKFTLSRSNLDQPRAAALLQGVLANDHLEEMDFSYCKLENDGAHAVGEFLRMHKGLKILHLANNGIEALGVSGMMHGLLKRDDSMLKHLNLSLNPLLNEGVAYICSYLIRKDSLEVLNLSGCGITADGGKSLFEVLASGTVNFQTLSVDVSNNDLGKQVGQLFEDTIKTSPFIMGFTCRMCNFSKQSEFSIHESVLSNRRAKRKEEETRAMLLRLGKPCSDTAHNLSLSRLKGSFGNFDIEIST